MTNKNNLNELDVQANQNTNDENRYTEDVSQQLGKELSENTNTRMTNAQTNEAPSYDDVVGNKKEYSPNAEGLSNTGSGVESALGGDGKPIGYSWEKQGSSQAQKTYSSDVLTAKQNALTNRQTIENNAVNYQAQADMMKYQNNQNAEKVGWTGGYVLDQNRQMEYLKASIQAQMYGAMELQKYGYDSSLAAARLSYDLNQQEYARQYYQEAVSNALNEAQLTGTYFSAETKDMMSQLAVAQQKLDDPNISEKEKEQAQTIKNSIYNWFSANGISQQGVKTLSAWQQDQANELEWSQELWKRYEAAIEAANTKLDTDSSTFIMLDENGREMWDGVNVRTGKWDTMDGKTIADYILGSENQGNQQAIQQYYSYLDSTIVGETEVNFKKYCINQGWIKETKDASGNTETKLDETINWQSALLDYLNNSDIVKRLRNKFNNISEDQTQMLSNIFENFDFTINLPNGETTTLTYKELNNIQEQLDDNLLHTTGEQQYITDSNGKEITDEFGNKIPYTNLRNSVKANNNGSYSATLSNEKEIYLTTATLSKFEGRTFSSGMEGMNVVIDFDGDSYNGVEISSSKPVSSNINNSITSFVYQATNSYPKKGQVVAYNNNVYVYLSESTDPGWYKLGGVCGGKGQESLYNTFKNAGQAA